MINHIMVANLKSGDRVIRPGGIFKVASTKPVEPISLAQTEVTWEGGKVEKFCDFKCLLVKVET